LRVRVRVLLMLALLYLLLYLVYCCISSKVWRKVSMVSQGPEIPSGADVPRLVAAVPPSKRGSGTGVEEFPTDSPAPPRLKLPPNTDTAKIATHPRPPPPADGPRATPTDGQTDSLQTQGDRRCKVRVRSRARPACGYLPEPRPIERWTSPCRYSQYLMLVVAGKR